VTPRWEHFAHGADIGVRGIGPTRASAFEAAAQALTGVVCEPAAVAPRVRVDVECRAPSDELLLADWLNAVVFEMATRRMLFGAFEVKIENDNLHAVLWGEPIDPVRHEPAVEVKGATHTELRVAQQPDGLWIAQCVVDV
jgi:tRNA nucleotidyltransferase (CCA-adding enzyme)